MARILLVDDNREILSANSTHLQAQGFAVSCVDTGAKAITMIKRKQYDCILLDILLPDIDGFAVCKKAREMTDAPIIFLSCLDGSEDKIKGLMTGGDDYISKPYSLKELTARIHAILRRTELSKPSKSDFIIDRNNKILQVCGKNVLLSEREFKLFLLFFENPRKVFSKEEILNQIWSSTAESGVVAVLVLKLRRKIGFAEGVIGRIENDYGSGYCLLPPEK
jgi:DNA-binding response OmpR family regulator